MNRNIIISIITALCAMNALSASAVDYIVTGNISGHDDEEILIFDEGDGAIRINEGIINDGKFTISGNFSRDALAKAYVGHDYAYFLLDNDTVVLDFDNHAPLSGSETNMKLRELILTINSQYKREQDLQESMTDQGIDIFEAAQKAKKLHDEIIEKRMSSLKEIIMANPDNGIGEAAFYYYADPSKCTYEEWEQVYPKLSSRIKGLEMTTEYKRKFDSIKATSVGCRFTELDCVNLDGTEAKLSDYVGKGKYVIVDFWASWCKPCIMETTRYIKPFNEKYGNDERFTILGIAIADNVEDTRKAVSRHGLDWNHINAQGMKPMSIYGFNGVPMIMLFGPDGTILGRNLKAQFAVALLDRYLNRPTE